MHSGQIFIQICYQHSLCCFTESNAEYLPVRFKSIRDSWVRLHKKGKATPKKLDFLIGHVQHASQPKRFSNESQSSQASHSSQASQFFQASQQCKVDQDSVMDVDNYTGQDLAAEVLPSVDYQRLRKKELWLKRVKGLQEKEKEMQILEQIRFANELKNSPDNLRSMNTNFPREKKNCNMFSSSNNRLKDMIDDQAQVKADEDWCELIVLQILSVENSEDQLKVFSAIMVKSEEFQEQQ